MASPRRLLPVVLAALCALTVPAAASTRRMPQPLVDLPPQTTSFHDRVITGGPPRAMAAQSSGAQVYRTPDGTPVLVAFSSSYQPDPAVAQSYVDFLGSLPHGSELSRLRLLIVPPAETADDCGGQAGVVACYSALGHVMVVPGQQIEQGTGVSTSYVLTHEYGHHIAAFRANPPFPTLDWGPKYWDSAELVCDKVLRGRLAPGDEGQYYLLNPGESWAETYARLTYPDQPWQFTSLLRPDAAALAAARRDVLSPWHQPPARVFHGRFTARGPRLRRFRVLLTLDGAFTAHLHGPRGAAFDLRVSSLGKTRGRTRGHGAQDRLHWIAACRSVQRERVTITVIRRHGRGPFRLTIADAG